MPRVRNLVVLLGNHTRRLTIVIESPTPSTAFERLADEARELADLHEELAQAQRLNSITVMSCRTQPCLEMREQSDEMFHFVRGTDAHWKIDPSHG